MNDANELARVARILQDRGILVETDHLSGYRSDASFLTIGTPAMVIHVHNDGQVETVLKTAYTHRLKIYLRAAGSSTAGASLTPEGGVMVVTDRLNNIDPFGNVSQRPHVPLVDIEGKEVAEQKMNDRYPLFARVPAGLSTAELDRYLKPLGYQTAVVPSSGWSTIGGNYATNAGGNGTPMYGTFKDIVNRIWLYTIQKDGVRQMEVSDKDALVALGGMQGIFGIITRLDVRIVKTPSEEETLNVVVAYEGDDILTLGRTVGQFMVAMEKVCSPYIGEFLFADDSLHPSGEDPVVAAVTRKTAAYKIILIYNGLDKALRPIFDVLPNFPGFEAQELKTSVFKTLLSIRKAATGKSKNRIAVPGCEDIYIKNPLRFGQVLDAIFRVTAGRLPGRPIGHQYTGGIVIHYRPQALMVPDVLDMAVAVNNELNAEIFKPQYETVKRFEHGLGLELYQLADDALREKIRRTKATYDPLGLFNDHLLTPEANIQFFFKDFAPN